LIDAPSLLHRYLLFAAVGTDRSETESEDGLVIHSSRLPSCINSQVWLGACSQWVGVYDRADVHDQIIFSVCYW